MIARYTALLRFSVSLSTPRLFRKPKVEEVERTFRREFVCDESDFDGKLKEHVEELTQRIKSGCMFDGDVVTVTYVDSKVADCIYVKELPFEWNLKHLTPKEFVGEFGWLFGLDPLDGLRPYISK